MNLLKRKKGPQDRQGICHCYSGANDALDPFSRRTYRKRTFKVSRRQGAWLLSLEDKFEFDDRQRSLGHPGVLLGRQ